MRPYDGICTWMHSDLPPSFRQCVRKEKKNTNTMKKEIKEEERKMQNEKSKKENSENDFSKRYRARKEKKQAQVHSERDTSVCGHYFKSHLYTMSHLMDDPERLAR